MTDQRQEAGAIIEVRGVTKSFGAIEALRGIDLDIREGEFFSLLGPSGCGKTTLLRLIAGFDDPTNGRILIDGKDMSGVSANRRPTNMVFQSYAIFPHLGVAGNVGYGLKTRGLPKAQIAREVEQALEMVDLAGFGERAAHELSGGQRQRVALARALVMRPKVVLLDEPLSALDKNLRDQMRVELRNLQRQIGITFILVTHDQDEAMIMSDRIAVMFDGRIAQTASPISLYRRPNSRRVASFFGVMNMLEARIAARSDAGVSLEIPALGRVALPWNAVSEGVDPAAVDGVGVRPELLSLLTDARDSAERETEVEVLDNVFYGDMTDYVVRLPGSSARVTVSMRNSAGRAIVAPGSRVRLGWSANSMVLFGNPARTEP